MPTQNAGLISIDFIDIPGYLVPGLTLLISIWMAAGPAVAKILLLRMGPFCPGISCAGGCADQTIRNISPVPESGYCIEYYYLETQQK